jgi:hypothetical protein
MLPSVSPPQGWEGGGVEGSDTCSQPPTYLYIESGWETLEVSHNPKSLTIVTPGPTKQLVLARLGSTTNGAFRRIFLPLGSILLSVIPQAHGKPHTVLSLSRSDKLALAITKLSGYEVPRVASSM